MGPWWPRTGPAHGRPWARCRSCTRRRCVTSRTPHVRSCSRPDPGPAPACGSLSLCHCPAGRGHCHPTHTPDNACSQLMRLTTPFLRHNTIPYSICMCSVAEWLACWTQAQKARVQIAVATLSGNSLRQTIHTHCASVHQPAKLVAALLRVAGVTAGLAESNGSLPPGLCLTSHAG